MSVAFHCENIEMDEIDDEIYDDVGPGPIYENPDIIIPPSQEQQPDQILQPALLAQLSSLAMRVNVTERHNAVPSVSSERKCGSMLLPFVAVGVLGLLLLAGITVGVHLLVKVNGSDTNMEEALLANLSTLEMRLNLTESHSNYNSTNKTTTVSDRKAVFIQVSMSKDMQRDAVQVATQALETYNNNRDIAVYIRKEFDKKYNTYWQCIVGRNFSFSVHYKTNHYIYFSMGQVYIMLFKSP